MTVIAAIDPGMEYKLHLSKTEQALEEARAFVDANVILARPGRKCVDGRYKPGQADGKIARPGGDWGYVEVLLALREEGVIDLSPEACIYAVLHAVKQIGDTFCMHTDHHADPTRAYHKNTSIGCGHIAKAAEPKNASLYVLSSEDVKKALLYTRELDAIDDKSIDMVRLRGEHKERGVLIINSEKYTVWSSDKENVMYFIYDKTRDEAFMKKLVKTLAIEGLFYKDFKRVSDIQLQATLELLAAGKPMFEITFDDATSEVRFLGNVSGE